MKRFKQEVVTDMSIGQVVDAILQGEVFYMHGREVLLTDNRLGIFIEDSKVYMDLGSLRMELERGFITHLVEAPWTEQLDGTWENGVWCKVWDCDVQYSSVAKVDKYNSDKPHYKYATKNCSWRNAEPVSEELAELLEKEIG